MKHATQTVIDIGELNLRGNIIPHIWYQRLTKEVRIGRNKETFTRPYLEAIIILSDIVYWYRPTTIRNEGTGSIIQVNRKFSADKLQRSYQQFADAFGFGKDQAKAACKWLENKGYITLELRNIMAAGTHLSNVLFIEPVTEKVKELCAIPYAFTKAHPPINESTPPLSAKDTYTDSSSSHISTDTNPANAGAGLVQEKQEPELPVEKNLHVFIKEYPPLEHKVIRPGLVATLQNPYGPDHYTDISIPPEARDIRCEVCGEEQNWPRKKALRRKEKSLTCSNAAGCGAYFRVRIEGTPETYALKLPSKEWLIKIESAPPGFQEIETTQEHLDNLLKCWAEDPGEYIGTMQWYAMQVHPGVRRMDVVIQRCNTGFDSKMAKKTASQQPPAPPPIIDHNITLVKPGYLM